MPGTYDLWHVTCEKDLVDQDLYWYENCHVYTSLVVKAKPAVQAKCNFLSFRFYFSKSLAFPERVSY